MVAECVTSILKCASTSSLCQGPLSPTLRKTRHPKYFVPCRNGGTMLKYLLAWSVLLVLLDPAAAFLPVLVGHHNSYTDYPSRGIPLLHATAKNGDNNNNSHRRNIVVLCHNVSQDVANGIFDVNNLGKGRIDVLARCVTSALWVSNGIRTDTTVYLLLGTATIEIQGSRVKSLTPEERTVALYLQRTLWNGGKKGGQEASNNMNKSMSDSVANNTFQSQTPISRNTTNKYVNPHATPMSEEKRLRDKHKGRDALIHRIQVAHHGKADLPGFRLHPNDSLKDRLNQLLVSGEDDIYMLSETGDPLWDVLEEKKSKRGAKIHNNNNGPSTSKTAPATTTTLILGNQLGYSAEDEQLLLGTPNVREVSLGSLSLLTSQCITITQHYLDRFEFEHK